MSRRYHAPAPGEATVLRGRRGVFAWKVMCCDCALVHIFMFELQGTRLLARAWRHERATAAARRRKKK